MADQSPPKTILIGLDGGDFRILDPLISDGRLPTIARLARNGTRGFLRSTVPANTVPSWNSIFTGVNPGKHGVIDFLVRMDKKYIIATSRLRAVPSIWKILSRRGKRLIIVNEPVTYPPEEINGVMLTGFATPPGAQDYAYPREVSEVVDKVTDGYSPELEFGYEDLFRKDKPKAIQLVTEFAQKHYKATMHLAHNHEWDLLSVTFTSTDRLQHFCYDDEETISRHYEMLDSMIKDICNLSSDANVFIISDHGFCALRKTFFINRWLYNRGLANIQGTSSQLFGRMGLTSSRVTSIAVKLRVNKIALRLIPYSLKEAFPKDDTEGVDYATSQIAQRSTNGGLYFNNTSKISEVAAQLRSLRLKGEKPFEEVMLRDEVWSGDYVGRAPEVIFTPTPGYEISPRMALTESGEPSGSGDIRSGTHSQNGIFIAAGHDIRALELKSPLNTWDITPTILYSMGIRPPAYMDGAPLRRVFKGEIQVSDVMNDEDVKYLGPEGEYLKPEEAKAIEERLKSLGYE